MDGRDAERIERLPLKACSAESGSSAAIVTTREREGMGQGIGVQSKRGKIALSLKYEVVLLTSLRVCHGVEEGRNPKKQQSDASSSERYPF